MAQTDLHMHSAVSVDGEISPRGLAELCCQEGVTLAALTDHNDIAGVAEFIWRCAQLGVQAIPGVELDCMFEGNLLHMLGYGIDIANALLLHTVQTVRGLQIEAGLRLMDAVAALGIGFDREQVLEWAGDGAVCAESIAQSALQVPENRMHPLICPLLPGGALSDRPLVNFYWSVCAPGKPAYVPVEFMAAGQAVDLMHAAGGIAVLAHPGISILDAAMLDACAAVAAGRCGSLQQLPHRAASVFLRSKSTRTMLTAQRRQRFSRQNQTGYSYRRSGLAGMGKRGARSLVGCRSVHSITSIFAFSS